MLDSQLSVAIYNGDIEEVKILIENHKVNINCQIYTRYTPLMDAILHEKLNIAKYLIDQKADIHLSSAIGNTALHLASKEGYLDIVQSFVVNGADINCKNGFGSTPLNYAIKNNQLHVASYLISAGATVTPEIIEIMKAKNVQAIKQIACSRVFHFYNAGVSENQYANNNLEN